MSNLGTDFHCDDDITDDGAVAASPELAFLQALYRRAIAKKLFYVEPYGLAAFEMLLESGLTKNDIVNMVTTEFLRDERVKAVTITGTIEALEVKVTPHGSDVPIDHTLTIDAVAGVIAIEE
jgi:hypothetical protein